MTGSNWLDAFKGKPKQPLTVAELSNLWITYMRGTMTLCGLKYFLAKVEDPDIERILHEAKNIALFDVQKVTDFFSSESITLPNGFTDKDVNTDAPRLYSDAFFLAYILHMAKFLLTQTGLMVTQSARLDIVDFYSKSLVMAKDLHRNAKKTALEKGLYVRPPYITNSKQNQTVEEKSFLKGLLGKARPLMAQEITNLVYNIKRNTIGKALSIGFSQVAQSDDVRAYMIRGRDISKKHIDAFSDVLKKEFLPVPMAWDEHVLDSTEPPFSDKLMMYHIGALAAYGIGEYGMSIAQNPRPDLTLLYARLAAEIGRFAHDGMKIMIDHGWFEQPPLTVDRNALALKGKSW